MAPRLHTARKILEVAFPNVLSDSVYTWTDLSPWMNDVSNNSFNRGRQNELQTFNAGDGSAALINNDRRFEPQYALGAYYPNVDLEKPIQFSLEYPWLPAALNDGAFEYGTDGWSVLSGPATLVWNPGGGWLYLGADALRATSTGSGAVNLLSDDFPVNVGETWYVSQRLKGSHAGDSYQMYIRFYTSVDGTSGFISDLGTAAITTTTAWQRYGLAALVTAPAGAKSARVLVVWTPTATAQTVDLSHVVVDQVSFFNAQQVKHLGYIDDWIPSWNIGDNQVIPKWHDGFKALGTKNINNRNFEASVVAQGWTYYWPMSEPLNSTQIQDIGAGGNKSILPLYGTAVFGINGPLIADPDTGVDFYGGVIGAGPTEAGTGFFNLPDACAMTSGAAWSMMFAFQYSGPSDRIIQQGPVGDPRSPSFTNFWNLFINANGTLQFSGTDVSSNSYVFNTTFSFTGIGTWVFLVLVKAANNRDVYLYIFNPVLGYILLATTNVVGGTVQGDGHWKADTAMNFTTSRLLVAGKNNTPAYSGQLAQMAVWPGHAVTTTEILTLSALAVSQWTGQTITQRMNQVLDTIGWPAGLRDLDTVSTIANNEVVNLSNTNALQYLQRLAASDGGWLYMSHDGKVTFRSRATLERAPYSTVQYVLSDRGGETDTPTGLVAIPFSNATPQYGDETLYNEAGLNREIDSVTNGAIQLAEDYVSQGKFFKRTLPTGQPMLLASDADALALAQWRVAYYGYPRMMFTSVKVECYTDDVWKFALNVKIGDRVAILVHPMPMGAGGPIRVEVVVQGLQASWQRGLYVLTLQLGMAPPTILLLDDPVFGLLDMGNRLGY